MPGFVRILRLAAPAEPVTWKPDAMQKPRLVPLVDEHASGRPAAVLPASTVPAAPLAFRLTRRELLRLGLSTSGAALLAACGDASVGSLVAAEASEISARRPQPLGGVAQGGLGNPGVGSADEPIAQFLTHDGSSGTSQKCWNHAVDLRWRNPGVGDWLDANGEAQGAQAFAVAPVTGPGPVSWDVTALVRRQVEGENRGFFMQSSGTLFPVTFAGRAADDAMLRPLLLVETDQGVFECRARATARWLIRSINRSDSSKAFRLQQDQAHGIVQFDYLPVRGSVRRATMTLTVTGFERKGEVRVFEADPPRYVTGRGPGAVYGLAAAGDEALRAHPSVLHVGDPRESEPGTGIVPVLMTDADTGLKFHRCTLRAGQHEIDRGSAIRGITLVRADAPYGPPTSVVEEIYFRYRVRFGDDWRSTVDASKMPGIDMGFGYWTEGNYWQQVSGNGGVPGDGRYGPSWHTYKTGTLKGQSIWGYHGHMTRGHGGQYYADGNPYAELFLRHSTYAYHLDPSDPNYNYGEVFRWGNAVLQRGRWHDIEHHVKVNSLIGAEDQYGNREAVYDGVYEGWIDGQLVFRKTNFRWRRHPLMGIESIWLGFYHGGKQPSPVTMHVDVGSIVVATEYIGPVTS